MLLKQLLADPHHDPVDEGVRERSKASCPSFSSRAPSAPATAALRLMNIPQ
jgi:hypothetical protein